MYRRAHTYTCVYIYSYIYICYIYAIHICTCANHCKSCGLSGLTSGSSFISFHPSLDVRCHVGHEWSRWMGFWVFQQFFKVFLDLWGQWPLCAILFQAGKERIRLWPAQCILKPLPPNPRLFVGKVLLSKTKQHQHHQTLERSWAPTYSIYHISPFPAIKSRISPAHQGPSAQIADQHWSTFWWSSQNPFLFGRKKVSVSKHRKYFNFA